jgi:predicted metalloprotease with PDZ domain
LQLRHTSITAADLELLHRAEQLEGLEIMYTPIDDEAIETLATLPLAGRIRLFGTRISEAGVEKLRGQLEGSEINFGRGGFLGISSQSMSLVLTMVNPGSAADKAGLRVNDRILKIQGIELKTFEELRNELAKYAPGEEVTLTFERRGSGLELPDGEPSNFQAEVRVILGEQN